MYNGIGLLTARGSGTSGHVQSNSFNIRSHARNPQDYGEGSKPARVRKADDRILEHERKREIELKLVELAESLEETGYSTAEIEREVQEMRLQMLQDHASMSEDQTVEALRKRDDSHAVAKRKEIELKRFQDAFGVRGDEAEKDATPAQQQAIEGLPERLMIENGKPPVNDRFAAEEKALEEKLLREEEEEIAVAREERLKRKAERQRRKEEKAAAKAAEEARIAEERAAREEEQRHADDDRRRASAELLRRHEREYTRERGDRGGYSSDAYWGSRGAHDSHRSRHDAYYDRGHRHRDHEYGAERTHRDGGYRDREQDDERYVEEVGTMARHYQKYADADAEHGGYKRRRVAEEDMHQRHALRGRDREYNRERAPEGLRGEEQYYDRENEYRERDRRVVSRGRDEDSRHIREELKRNGRDERSNGHGTNGRAHAYDEERQHGRGRQEDAEEDDRMHEHQASRQYKDEYERQDPREGHMERHAEHDREGRYGEGDDCQRHEVDEGRHEPSRDRYGGYRDEQRREEPARADRREHSRYERANRERGQEEEGGRGDVRVQYSRGRSVPAERQRQGSGYKGVSGADGRAEENRGGRRERSVARIDSRSQSPSNSDSLSFGTSSSDEA